MFLHNRVNKKELKEKIKKDTTKRITFSFYRYVIIDDPKELRDSFFFEWSQLGALGRIYLAKEGINAQMNVPEQNFEAFQNLLYSDIRFKNVPFKIAVEDDGK